MLGLATLPASDASRRAAVNCFRMSDSLSGLFENWRPPAELSGPLPRPVRLNGRGTILVVAMLINAAVGIFSGIAIGIQSNREAREQQLLKQEGVSANAVITRLWQTSGKNPHLKVSYQFEYQGSTFSGIAEPPRAAWRELSTGSTIPIRFAPSSPGINEPTIWRNPATSLWLGVFVTGFLLAVTWFLWRPIRDQKRLLQEGRAAPAIITGYRAARKCRFAEYRFPLPGGGVIQAKPAPIRTYPEIGSTICIIYDRDDPQRSAPYPLQFLDAAGATKVHASSRAGAP